MQMWTVEGPRRANRQGATLTLGIADSTQAPHSLMMMNTVPQLATLLKLDGGVVWCTVSQLITSLKLDCSAVLCTMHCPPTYYIIEVGPQCSSGAVPQLVTSLLLEGGVVTRLVS